MRQIALNDELVDDITADEMTDNDALVDGITTDEIAVNDTTDDQRHDR